MFTKKENNNRKEKIRYIRQIVRILKNLITEK